MSPKDTGTNLKELASACDQGNLNNKLNNGFRF